jgi:hypothetical protein
MQLSRVCFALLVGNQNKNSVGWHSIALTQYAFIGSFNGPLREEALGVSTPAAARQAHALLDGSAPGRLRILS